MQTKYANIIIDIVHEDLDRTFQYKIPEELLEEVVEGMEVIIPFGKSNRQIKGYVISISTQPEYDPSKIKNIIDISKDSLLLESKQIKLAAWIKENYGSSMIQALKTVLPIKQKVKSKERKFLCLQCTKDEAADYLRTFEKKKFVAKSRLLKALIEEPVLSYEKASKQLKVSMPVIRSFEKDNIIRVDVEKYYRNPVKQRITKAKEIELNEEQEVVVSKVWSDYSKDIMKTYLLHGVTGSGKTEVYMELISKVIAQGKQVIFLIPEISLTYQMVLRFYQRFNDRVSIMNSRLSQGEKCDQMLRAKNHDIDIMIGPRSALFAPFPDIGLIIIDEEHEGSYKSETMPRYHARETAIAWAKMVNASVILGSATPSIESYYKSINGEYELLELKERVEKRNLPKVYTIDLREELRSGNRSILSNKLQELITDRLNKKQQVMLFLNRRGFAGFVSCRSCGHVMKCQHCDVSLTIHKGNKLVCHYCGYEESNVETCPSCGSPFIGGFKAGTQKVEMMVQKMFPQARILRMDMDTTRSKEGHEKILSSFSNNEADILIGTQMIVKGHDFHNVTLVGILAADLSLNVSDYRASERTFQLLTQAAGRAGRGEMEGEVVIQTYSPEHYSITSAAKQDYREFYEQEIMYRTMMSYPPIANLMVIMMTALDEAYVEKRALLIKELIEKSKVIKNIRVIGPAWASVAKVHDKYQQVIYIKAKNYHDLVTVKDEVEYTMENQKEEYDFNIQFDFNPMTFI